jgi:hypothetical protein
MLNFSILFGMSLGEAVTVIIVLLVLMLIVGFIQGWPIVHRFLAKHKPKKFKSSGDLKKDIIGLSGETRRVRDTAGFWDPIGFQSAIENNTKLQVREVHEYEIGKGTDVKLDKLILELSADKKTVYVGAEVDYLDSNCFPKGSLIEEDGKCQVITKIIWVIPDNEGYDLKKKTLVDALANSMIVPQDRTFSDGFKCLMLNQSSNFYEKVDVITRDYHLNMNPQREFGVKFSSKWETVKHSKAIHKAVDFLNGGNNNLTIEGASGTGKSVLAQMICDIASTRGTNIVYLTTTGFMKLLTGEALPPDVDGNKRIIYVDQLGEAATDTTLLANLESLLDGPTRSAMPNTSFLFVCTQEVYSKLPSDIKRVGRLFARIQLKMCKIDEIKQIDEILSINSSYMLDMPALEAYMSQGKTKRTSLSLSEVYLFKVFDDSAEDSDIPDAEEIKRKKKTPPKSRKPSNNRNTTKKSKTTNKSDVSTSINTEDKWF